jgi:uncharacterized heparinase superfamily protein
MSRVSVTDQAKLSLFLARAILRALAGQFVAFWIYRLPLFSSKNDRLVIAPQDLRTADATQAAEIHSGRFVFAGKVATGAPHSRSRRPRRNGQSACTASAG